MQSTHKRLEKLERKQTKPDKTIVFVTGDKLPPGATVIARLNIDIERLR